MCQLTHKQCLLSCYNTHFEDVVVIFHLEGCAYISCFKKLVGKIVKIVKLDSMDENEEDDLVGTNTTEAA